MRVRLSNALVRSASSGLASAATTLPRRQRSSDIRALWGPALRMWVIVLEMLAALAVLLFIVWWTMFAGRRRGERRDDHDAQ